MHVTSEEGDYSFTKEPPSPHQMMDTSAPSEHESDYNLLETSDVASESTVCGLYVVTDPDKDVEITITYLNIDCESGGLMAVGFCLLFFFDDK